MVISLGRIWYVYGGVCNMCRGVITEVTGGIADVSCKRFRDADSYGLKCGNWKWMGWGKSMNGQKSGKVGGWSNCYWRVVEYLLGLEM
jgi:hypothetical protein